MWRLDTLQCTHILAGHSDWVCSLAVGGGGRLWSGSFKELKACELLLLLLLLLMSYPWGIYLLLPALLLSVVFVLIANPVLCADLGPGPVPVH